MIRSGKRDKFIGFREESYIIDLLDEVVKNRGLDRSDFIRETIRKRLASMGLLSEEDTSMLKS